MNRSLKERLNEKPRMNFEGPEQERYELKDQFSFRQGLYSGNDENMPTISKTYSQKQFQNQNGTFDDLDRNLSMT